MLTTTKGMPLMESWEQTLARSTAHLLSFNLPWPVLLCKHEEQDFTIVYCYNCLILLLVIVDNLKINPRYVHVGTYRYM